VRRLPVTSDVHPAVPLKMLIPGCYANAASSAAVGSTPDFPEQPGSRA
jgi:hypothetical protein